MPPPKAPNGAGEAAWTDTKNARRVDLGLDADEAIEFRMIRIGIIALAAKCDPELHRKLIGLPSDLPDLQRLRPPGGNSRPDGVKASWYARRERGGLPETY